MFKIARPSARCDYVLEADYETVEQALEAATEKINAAKRLFIAAELTVYDAETLDAIYWVDKKGYRQAKGNLKRWLRYGGRG